MQAVEDSIATAEVIGAMKVATRDQAKLDDSGAEILSDEDEVNGPEDEMLAIADGGLFFDPTAECEGDDFQDTVPIGEGVGKFGIRGKSSLLPMDGCDLMKSQRLGFTLRSQKKRRLVQYRLTCPVLILYLI